MEGYIVSIEGIDGSGKSIQTALLLDWLKTEGYDAILVTKPGSSHIGALIKKLNEEDIPISPTAKILLYAADFSVIISTTIIPALKERKIVLNDRYIHSPYAYGVALGIPIEWIRNVYDFVPEPTLTFILDISPQTALERLKGSGGKLGFYCSGYNSDVQTREKSFLEFQEKVREQYINLSRGNHRIHVIDGSKDILDIHQKMRKILLGHLRAC